MYNVTCANPDEHQVQNEDEPIVLAVPEFGPFFQMLTHHL